MVLPGTVMDKRLHGLLMFALAGLMNHPPASAADDPPAWAYPVNPPDFKPAADDGVLRHVPDSTVEYPLPQLRNRFLAPDWHPEGHPQMPAVVANGRKPDVSACGFCHRAEGTGGPENASLAGLPFAYIVQQLADYKSGARSTAVPGRAPHALMIAGARALTDAEAQEAAGYFSRLGAQARLRVVESERVPLTHVTGWILARADATGTEALGQRIVELPDDLENYEHRDSRATFTAYVPPASIQRGEALVSGQDSAKAPACATCHGKDLRGLEARPSIAGRSPTYVFRQLYEIQRGVRNGAGVQPMKDAVARLSRDDMIAIAAYLGTLKP